ncbi:class I SAM-dependent methyltransferase [Polynucleobacter brandtiae]|uniref:Methyltransferase family protein n=1 Tax=Polynucleobacter brandtiae TaxID=1938816 RepID=A0A2M8VJJ2_9BURK|nr:class I SAM-dependent methyltransferase [Polynucleobacter brandtiae]PJI77161.1 methyltransferase family protein [Polynucleobacter brandtiae]
MKSYLRRARNYISELWYRRPWCFRQKELLFTQILTTVGHRDDIYRYMHRYFYNICPVDVRDHRKYFSRNKRGFGEDALHAMWFSIFKQFRPIRCLEIGVYRGQVISLWALLAKKFDFKCDIHGISPFENEGDSVSNYIGGVNYYQDVLQNHKVFNLATPSLFRGYSADELAIEYIKSISWDLIYIDGNHNYDVAIADYELSIRCLNIGGILVMDDSSLYADYNPSRFAFAGHPGPSRVVKERAMNDLILIGSVGHNNVFQKLREI